MYTEFLPSLVIIETIGTKRVKQYIFLMGGKELSSEISAKYF